MSKLTLDALKERAEAVASTDLLNTISGGTENACHDSALMMVVEADMEVTSSLGDRIWNWIFN